MITYPHKNISVGKVSLRLGCVLSELSGKTDYHVGDRLRGELLLRPYQQDLELERVEARLLYVLQGRHDTGRTYHTGVLVGENISVPRATQVFLPFSVVKPFDRANSKHGNLRATWELSLIFYPRKPSGDLSSTLRAAIGHFDPTTTNLQVPVVLGKGQYRAFPRPLPIRLFKPREIAFSLVLLFVILFNTFAPDRAPNLALMKVLLLIFTLVLTALALLRLSRLRDIPMAITETGDGKLRLRILDRGDGSWRKLKIGYQVVCAHLVKGRKGAKLQETALYKKELELSDLARQDGLYVEADLPWPEWPHDDLPVSYTHHRQGYTWEVYIKRPGIFGEQFQSWPVTVSWEPYRLTEAQKTKEEEPEHLLELEELPEPIPVPKGRISV